MKVLILSSHLTHPTDAGNRAAIMSQVEIFERLGHEVHFLFVDMSLRKKENYHEMEHYWGDRYHQFNQSPIFKAYRLYIDFYRTHFCHGYWKHSDHYVKGLDSYINRLQETYHFGAIIIQYMRFAKVLPLINIPRKAIYTHDVFAYKDLRTGHPFYETCNADEEAKAMQCCPNIFAIQETEAAYYSILSPKSKIYTVYCPYQYHRQEISKDPNILYIASSMSFNVNGIQWFIDHVWYQFLQIFPFAHLIIAGGVCSKIRIQDKTNIELLGYVDSLPEFYKKGNIVINPVYQGTGLKIKTFEALSYGKTAVVHPHSLTGIYDKEHAPLLQASSPEEWIGHLSQIMQPGYDFLQQQQRAENYIKAMNQHVEKQYQNFLSELNNTLIPKKIHYCWFGKGEKSHLINRCIETWKKIHPDYEIKEWNENNFDIDSIPFTKEAYKARKWAFVSDFVRLHALYTEGGIYLDTDIELMKPLDRFLNHTFFTCQEIHPDILVPGSILPDGRRNPEYKQVLGVGICSAVLGASPSNQFIKECLDYYKKIHFSLEEMPNLVIVNILAVQLEKYNYRYISDIEQYLPGGLVIFKPNVFAGMTTFDESSYALHLYNGSWLSTSNGFKHKLRNQFPNVYINIQKIAHFLNYYSKKRNNSHPIKL